MSERLTPHVIGNQGEAPFDAEPGIVQRIRTASQDIDAVMEGDSALHGITTSELDRIMQCLDEIARDLDAWCRDHGMTP